MYKDFRYINAGTNEVYRYGRKAVERVSSCLTPNEKGFYSIAADGGKYWTFGTSTGKYGEYAKINGVCFSVNSAGFIWAKAGTEKAEAFVQALESTITYMKQLNASRFSEEEEEENE